MDELALTCERIASHASRLKKVAILARYLGTLNDADLQRAVRFLSCCPIQSSDHKFSLGGATLRAAARSVTGLDNYIMGLCHASAGDTGETVSLLLRGKTEDKAMTLADAELLYARLHKMRRTADRLNLLEEIYRRYQPITLKFFLKVITGNLRIGLLERTVEDAVAAASGVGADEIRKANNRLGDLPRVALAARSGELQSIEARLFHPMEFMLAKPLDNVAELPDPTDWYIEDKFDGFRSQAHIAEGRVVIFTRGSEDVTHAFPEIVDALKDLQEPSVIDGEILAWRDDRALPFTVLQQRIARKRYTADLGETVPVAFAAYDLLYHAGRMLVDLPIEERRRALENIIGALNGRLKIAEQWQASSVPQIDESFARARDRGNEGLLLKQKGSLYEGGRRSGAWLKVKRAYGTLDVVITAAETGSGRRAIYLSDYTFGVRDGERVVNVGKAYSGLTDAEVRELTRILRSKATDRLAV